MTPKPENLTFGFQKFDKNQMFNKSGPRRDEQQDDITKRKMWAVNLITLDLSRKFSISCQEGKLDLQKHVTKILHFFE